MATALEHMFYLFAKFGDGKADGTTISLSQIDKWFKQAGVIDQKEEVTTADTAANFQRFKCKAITYNDLLKLIDRISNEKHLQASEIKEKLANCGDPIVNTVDRVLAQGAVGRLTQLKESHSKTKDKNK